MPEACKDAPVAKLPGAQPSLSACAKIKKVPDIEVPTIPPWNIYVISLLSLWGSLLAQFKNKLFPKIKHVFCSLHLTI